MSASNAILGFGTLLKRGDGGVGAGVKAFKTWGTANTSIRILAKIAGTAGNAKTVTVTASGASFVKTTLTATVIAITIPTTATVAQVCAWLYQDATFQANWDADYNSVGDGSGVCPAQVLSNLASGSEGTEIFTTVSEIQSISMDGTTIDLVDVTHMESPNGYKEFISGLKDGGTVTFNFSYVPTDAQQKGLITDQNAGTKRNYKMVLPDVGASYWAFNAIVQNFKVDPAFADKLSASVTLKVNGAITPPA